MEKEDLESPDIFKRMDSVAFGPSFDERPQCQTVIEKFENPEFKQDIKYEGRFSVVAKRSNK